MIIINYCLVVVVVVVILNDEDDDHDCGDCGCSEDRHGGDKGE